MRKAVLLFFVLTIILVGGLTLKSRSQEVVEEKVERKSVNVATQLAGASQEVVLKMNYPTLIKSEKEVVAKAKSNGQIAWLNFAVGDQISQGEILVKVDALGALTAGENNFSSNQIQQQELLLAQAKKAYGLAKDNYHDDDSPANETAKKIAKLQYQAAQITLQNSLNDALLTAPLSGMITEKLVSEGDTVAIGQAIAKISQLGNKKAQFFVERDVLEFIQKGDLVTVQVDGQSEKMAAKISLISLEADSVTKKFKIEADFSEKDLAPLGTIGTVVLEIRKKVKQADSFLLPISALTIGQNETFLFVSEGGRAKKVLVEIEEIAGEFVQIKAALDLNAKIILDGNGQVQDGTEVIDIN